jgi:hypothetical protein
MCYFEQTQYLACGHNIEVVIEKCELGEKYRTSMHDKIITALHSNDGQCEKCNPPPAYISETIDLTSDLPEATPMVSNPPYTPTSDSTSNGTSHSSSNASFSGSDVRYPLVDLTDDSRPQQKRPRHERRDSIGEDLMDLN